MFVIAFSGCNGVSHHEMPPLAEPDHFIKAKPVLVAWDRMLDKQDHLLGYVKTNAFRPEPDGPVHHFYAVFDFAYRQIGHITQKGRVYRYTAIGKEEFIGRFKINHGIAILYGRDPEDIVKKRGAVEEEKGTDK